MVKRPNDRTCEWELPIYNTLPEHPKKYGFEIHPAPAALRLAFAGCSAL